MKMQQPQPINQNNSVSGSFSQHTSSIYSLLYKNIKIHQKNILSNICQIITPLLCIAFTLLAQLISGQILSSKIQSFNFPQPLDNPYFYTLTKSSLNLSCEQNYLYKIEGNNKNNNQIVKKILSHTLKYYCDQTDSLMPKFIQTQTETINQFLMKQIKIADVQPFQRGDDLKTLLPDAYVNFKSIQQNKYNLTFGINDLRLPQYHKNNGITKIIFKTSQNQQIISYLRVTQGMMSIIQKINRAILQLSNPKQIIMGNYMYMPFDGEDKSLKNKIINILGAGLYPLGLSLLIPLFLFSIVNEKQQRLIEIMKMNGLNVKYYWISTFIFNFFITMFMMVVFYGFGRYYLKLTLFLQTDIFLFWLLLIGWAISLISMTNFVQIFINSAKSATIVGYLLSITSCFVGEAITTFIYAYPQNVPIYILLYPPFALCRAIYLIGFNCASNSSCYKGISQVDPEFINILIILYSWFFVYIFSIYLNEMIQQQYGVAKYPDFIQNCIKYCQKKKIPQNQLNQETFGSRQDIQQIQMNQSTKLVIQDDNILIDQSVQKLNEYITDMPINSKPMIIKRLSKKYETQSSQNRQYIALKPLSLTMQQKQIFGLLGPNGAGKTTMLSVITGMYPQTSGNAWINGISIGTSITNKFIGVCPQFDLLWADLTVYQHLKFYSLLKNVNKEKIQSQIQQLMKDVDLNEWKNTPSSQLSGGMQRRLSLAISLVGNPKVVFLDQPSSGLDPSHRRQMWNILLKCKKRTSILLTTHLMQQAQALCDRVGIINKGQLRCIGTINDLKQKFGKGYRLTLSYTSILKSLIKRKSGSSQQLQKQNNFNLNGNQNTIQKMSTTRLDSSKNSQSNQIILNNRPFIIDEIIQKYNAQIVNQLNTRIILKINKNQILKCISDLKHQKQINWLVNQPSLYDVFIHFIK